MVVVVTRLFAGSARGDRYVFALIQEQARELDVGIVDIAAMMESPSGFLCGASAPLSS